MNKKIKFRGKRLDNEEWVYGYYVCLQDTFRKPINKQERITHRIYTGYADSCASRDGYDFSEDWVHIAPETVGQFTGLHDCNGKEIYEGDLLKVWMGGDLQANPLIVKDMCELYFKTERDDSYYRITKMEVVGNIHNNPELKGDEQ